MASEHFDVIIVGAGLSGIAAAYYLQKHNPKKSFTILEGREAIGGTWDLFRYPGIRSDSSMFSFGYSFRPWDKTKSLGDGETIREYIRETAKEHDIERHIRFKHRLCRASWSSQKAHWTVDVQHGNNTIQLTCKFLFMCTGYYSYESGYTPEWQGFEDYQGCVIHPQKWPEDLDYTGKSVVVIGSGATAMTLVPAMSEQAAHVTMLQRSPTYVVSRPSEDALAKRLKKYLPSRLSSTFLRWRSILLGQFFYNLLRRKPEESKQNLITMAKNHLGEDYDVETHFTPEYYPWDQRLCLIPDADLFKAINTGKASVVTEQIERFTEDGILLKSGEKLTADIIITATGLVMKLMEGVELLVDGEAVNLGDRISYKGMMYSDVPNLASVFGYANASWTLKCELICEYVCRILHHMDKHHYQECRPVQSNENIETEPFMDFTSGYVQRALESLPKQGTEKPWKIHQNYLKDIAYFKFSPLDDGVMEFRK